MLLTYNLNQMEQTDVFAQFQGIVTVTKVELNEQLTHRQNKDIMGAVTHVHRGTL